MSLRLSNRESLRNFFEHQTDSSDQRGNFFVPPSLCGVCDNCFIYIDNAVYVVDAISCIFAFPALAFKIDDPVTNPYTMDKIPAKIVYNKMVSTDI